jgi:hypothetical protein
MTKREINWFKTGLLDNTPENKRRLCINNLEYAIQLLNTEYDSDNWDVEEWIIPIIIRIHNIININKNFIENLIPKIIKYRKEMLILGFEDDNEIKIIENFVNNEVALYNAQM